uniref:Carbohydrate-selective porin OprB n=1 Tax=Rhodopseudomonas palustris (strain BisA53) TaxID=316055 RepID=Q07KD5_RHOP5
MTRVHNKTSAARRLVAAAFAISALGATGTAAFAEESLAERSRLTGDWGGARTALEDKGIEIGIAYIGEVLGISGGVRPKGSTYAAFEGRLDVTINTDLEKLVGWTGGKTHIRAFQIHDANGKNAAYYTGSIADPSNIDAYATTRLFTAWYQQEFGTFASIRLGQLAADDEFLTSSTAGGLINGTFGWAALMAANLPSGGPAYPLATPGVRLQVNPTENIALLGAVFAGDPAGRNCTGDNVQRDCNRHGTTFSLDGGAFWLGEAQYNVNQAKDATGLAGSYKLGAWYHTGTTFQDQYTGVKDRSNDWGMYGVVDQMLWRGKDASTSVFVRGGWTPSDRNPVSWYIDGGVGFKGFVPGRAADTLTVGVAHAKISKDAIAFEVDTGAWPQRTGETVLELSYIAQITPWWSLQPDFQYIHKPAGGNLVRDDGSVVEEAYVFGVRTNVTF